MNAAPLATGASGAATIGCPYGVVRSLIALLLLAAAGLKAHELATSPEAGSGFGPVDWWVLLVVEGEFALGWALLLGVCPGWTRRVAIVVFCLFTAVSLGKAISGAASCGCFGRLTVNPWYTVAIDAAVLSLLVGARPEPRPRGADMAPPNEVSSARRLFSPPFGAKARSGLAAAVLVLVEAGTASWITASRAFHQADDGMIFTDGKTVILQPDRWIGKRFPLLDHLSCNAGDDLAAGDWKIILFRRGCPGCMELLARYAASPHAETSARCAWVELPPFDGREQLPPGLFHATLSDRRRWFAPTPLVVLVRDGKVVNIVNALAKDSVP